MNLVLQGSQVFEQAGEFVPLPGAVVSTEVDQVRERTYAVHQEHVYKLLRLQHTHTHTHRD